MVAHAGHMAWKGVVHTSNDTYTQRGTHKTSEGHNKTKIIDLHGKSAASGAPERYVPSQRVREICKDGWHLLIRTHTGVSLKPLRCQCKEQLYACMYYPTATKAPLPFVMALPDQQHKRADNCEAAHNISLPITSVQHNHIQCLNRGLVGSLHVKTRTWSASASMSAAPPITKDATPREHTHIMQQTHESQARPTEPSTPMTQRAAKLQRAVAFFDSTQHTPSPRRSCCIWPPAPCFKQRAQDHQNSVCSMK
jgi:hypothetical protein